MKVKETMKLGMQKTSLPVSSNLWYSLLHSSINEAVIQLEK